MRSPFSPDVIAALIIGVIGTAVSRTAYVATTMNQPPAQFIVKDLREGNHTYQIHFREACIGNIETRLLVGQASALLVQGNLLIGIQKLTLPITFSSQLFFNPLYQLAEFSGSLESSLAQITVATKGVADVSVTGSITVGSEAPRSLALKIPGPFELRPLDPGAATPPTYGITSTMTSLPALPMPPQGAELSLREGERCTETPLNAAAYLQTLPPALQHLLGAAQ